jgi:pimeloyl-ACP methyl ester carboxylesterase
MMPPSGGMPWTSTGSAYKRSNDLPFQCHTARPAVLAFLSVKEALGLEGPVDLCGFSFGGRVSLAAAAFHPEHIRRLVVTGGVALVGWPRGGRGG